MLFKKLKIQNIRSYENLEIEFPKGSVLLSGDIGVGKTSVLLALQFALFGLQPGQKGASILRQGADRAYVYLDLEIDGKTIILERTLKRGKSISQETNVITIDGEKKELSTSEMKNQVIELLDYPKEFAKKSNLLYKFTVYTPQEEMKTIIQERPEVRLDTLRHIFGIDRYRRIKQNSQILLQKIKDAIKLKEVEIREINILREKLTNQTEDKIKLAKEINNLNIEHKKLVDEKERGEEKLKRIQEGVEEKQKFNLELEKKIVEMDGKMVIRARLEKEIAGMKKQVGEKINFSQERFQEVVNLLGKHKNLLDESNSKFLEVNSKISVLNSKKENALLLKEKVISLDNCPTCFQAVEKEHKDKISKRTQFDIDDVDRELEGKLLDKNQLIKNIEKEKELIKGYEQDRQVFERDKIKFEHQKQIETKMKSDVFVLERVLGEIEELKNKIRGLEKEIEGFAEIKKRFEDEKKNLENVVLKVKDFEIALAEKNKEVEILKRHLEELEKDINQKQKIRSQVDYLRELQDWLEEKFLSVISLTEKNVMIKLRSDFSEIFNEWFSVLVSDLSARLDEDFTPVISQQDYEIDYDFLSGGERTAVALAYRLALNQVLNSMLSRIKTKNILILDEPTDGFSEQQLDKMRDIFEQLNSEQMILVSHEQKIEGFVDKVIRIKKDGVSGIDST